MTDDSRKTPTERPPRTSSDPAMPAIPQDKRPSFPEDLSTDEFAMTRIVEPLIRRAVQDGLRQYNEANKQLEQAQAQSPGALIERLEKLIDKSMRDIRDSVVDAVGQLRDQMQRLVSERPATLSVPVLRCLIVDDYHEMRSTLARGLRNAGQRVVDVASIAEAFDHLKTTDVAIIDARLASENGMDLVVMIHDGFPRIHRIVLTGYATPDLIVQAERFGARVLQKPVPLDDILEILSEIHDEIHGEQAPVTER